MNSYKKYLQDEKRIKRWSICCWVSAGISWIIQQKYIQWIYQNLRYTKFGREFSIVFTFIVVFPCLLNLFLWPSQYYSEKELRENIPPIMIYQESNELKKSLKFGIDYRGITMDQRIILCLHRGWKLLIIIWKS